VPALQPLPRIWHMWVPHQRNRFAALARAQNERLKTGRLNRQEHPSSTAGGGEIYPELFREDGTFAAGV
jgi:hypothetical protein